MSEHEAAAFTGQDAAADKKMAFLPPHGGDTLALARRAGLTGDDACDFSSLPSLSECSGLCDFSVNVRPDGPPDYVRLALLRALSDVGRYPSPRGEEARLACARRYQLPCESVITGNGTSEFFLALARVLKQRGCPCAAIPEPAFGEYAEACERAGLETRHPACTLVPTRRRYSSASERTLLDWVLPLDELEHLPEHAALFLANPGNPAGTWLSPKDLVRLMARRPDLVYILDEAFMLYVCPDDRSFLPLLAAHLNKDRHSPLPAELSLCIVRSMTKFHALPGVRVGFLAATPDLAQAIDYELPCWNVNCLAIAALCALMEEGPEQKRDERTTRAANRRRRRELLEALGTLPLTPCRSAANYLLLRLDRPSPQLADRLLADCHLAVRDCATYQGLDDGRWLRVAVRTEKDQARLIRSLQAVLVPASAQGAVSDARADTAPRSLRTGRTPRRARALMLQGTSSGAGKSVLTAALCRIFRQDGLDVAPFKAQNMSLNSGVTPDGLEMGRAQILQAQAAGLVPDVRMNPVLLKPLTDKGSQVVLLGRPHATLEARAFLKERASLREPVREAYDALASEHELMILEGAGSPAEINLKQADLVNMAMARHAEARVLLVGDIDRGGVYASFLGTFMTFSKEEQALLAGFLVNRFRGDASLLQPAHDYLFRATGKPVLGVIPYMEDLGLPEEDSLQTLSCTSHRAGRPDALDMALIVLDHTANFTDMAPLCVEDDVTLRPVHKAEDLGDPDVILLPGSRSVAAAARRLQDEGLFAQIRAHARKGGWVVGLCGGMQLMGERLSDPLHVESATTDVAGLGLLPLHTTMEEGKRLRYREHIASPCGLPACQGYEIHHGRSRLTRPVDRAALFGTGAEAAAEAGRPGTDCLGLLLDHCLGTYVHGLLDNDVFRRALLDRMRASKGLDPVGTVTPWDVEAALDRLADRVREHVDLQAIRRMLGLAQAGERA